MARRASLALHSELSSYRENLIEHLFLGELLRHLWPLRVEVMKPQVDDGGYDLVLDSRGVVRHIRLKTSRLDATTTRQEIHSRLAKKAGGCVIWIQFNEQTFDLGPFLWFGGKPGKRLPSLRALRPARHKRDGAGEKVERTTVRVVPKGKFTKLESIGDVAMALFGTGKRPKRRTAAAPRSSSS